MADYGTIEHVGGDHWRLRFTRTLSHPQSKVWRAITQPDQLTSWFPTTIDGERAPGARLRFEFPNDLAPPMEGEMIAYEPESLIEFRWGPDIIRIELHPLSDGTELTLLDTLEERGKGARDGAGWHTCLDALEAALAGDDEARARMNHWADVHEHYVESFGPEAATIGPPEGMG